jgi:glycosyltransferase involved in cell wall biosynthesis
MTPAAPRRALTTAGSASRFAARPVAVEHPEAGRRPLRVALLATSVEFGGIERVLLNLLEHMDSSVELVPVVFTRTDIRETSFFDRLRAGRIAHNTLFVNVVRPYSILNPLVNLQQLVALVRRGGFDLIHSHGYRADVFGLAVARWCRRPIVSTCHGFVDNDARLRFYNALDARVLRQFTRVIAVSNSMKDHLVAHGVGGNRIRVITNAVTEASAAEQGRTRRQVRAAAGFADADFVFGYAGRLSEEKGVASLIDAFASLPAAPAGSRLLIVGDGPERQALEQQAAARGVASRTTFAGFQSDMGPWFSAMDAFVLPSLTEGTPMALLEAMGYRLPVIASAVGGVPAVLTDRENGLLVDPGSVAQLVQTMQALTTTPSLRKAVAEAGVQAIRDRYGVDGWIHRTREVYLEAMAEGRRT